MRDLVITAFCSALPAELVLTAIYAGDEIIHESPGIDALPWGGDDFPVIAAVLPAGEGEIAPIAWLYAGTIPEAERGDAADAMARAQEAAVAAFRAAGGVLPTPAPDPAPEPPQEAEEAP